MARVYRVIHAPTGRAYAMKTQFGDVANHRVMRNRFALETRLARSLHHAHLIGAVDEVSPGGHPFLILELAPGGSLEKRILRDGPLSTEEALGILRGVLTGLAALHEKGVVHRDVKPGNILLHPQSDGSVVPRLSDLGVAHVSGHTCDTVAGSVVGSPSYMPPEQARGEPVDARSDLYAVGATLEAMLTAELPFRGRPDEILAVKIAARARLGRSAKLEPQIRAFIRKLAAPRAEDRPQSAYEALGLLEVIERTLLERRRQVREAHERAPDWRRAGVAAAAVAIGALATAAPYLVSAKTPPPAPLAAIADAGASARAEAGDLGLRPPALDEAPTLELPNPRPF
ncbi:MAG: serine/threonine-protein kinase, partial [Myxococcota bacterium]